MDRPKLEVADVFRRYGETYRQEHGASLSMAQRRVMTAIEVCRTAVLGGHLSSVTIAGISATLSIPVRIAIAQNANRLLGLNGSKTVRPKLLNTQYFHVVFTLPQQIATIAYQNKRELYGILFRATAQTLLTIAAHPKHLGAEIGFLLCSTLGAPTCFIIPTYTVWSPAAVSLGRYPVDLLPSGILPAGPGALKAVSSPVSGISAESL